MNEPAEVGPFQRLVEWLGYEYDPRFAGAAAALVAIGVFVPAWWWFRGWWRQRRQVGWVCPGCTYDLRGIAREAAFPFRCAECGLEIGSQRQLTKTRRGKRLLGVALLIFAVAHFTALGPEVKRAGWVRLVPATALVLQPMDVAQWTTSRARRPRGPGLQRELSRRLEYKQLWSWQEWILAKRVERACRARDDYGITPVQYDMAVRLHTTPARAWDEETTARRLVRVGESADVPLDIDWASLSLDGWLDDELVPPAPTNATAADVLEDLFDPHWPTSSNASWDITPEGVVVAGESQAGSTARTRIYDVSHVRDESGMDELIDLIQEVIEPESWVDHGGSVGATFGIAGHLVIIAPTRLHFEIEDLLDNLRQVGSPEAAMPAHPTLWNGRAFTVRSDRPTGMLDHLRGLLIVQTRGDRLPAAGRAQHAYKPPDGENEAEESIIPD